MKSGPELGEPVKSPVVGVLGGTFDPVHEGHLAMAAQVLAQGLAEEICFLPAAYPPHKEEPVASFSHRVAMLEAALEGRRHMFISTIEATLDRPSYTIRTVQALRRQQPTGVLRLIIGADALLDLPHWYQNRSLISLVDWIVLARGEVDHRRLMEAIRRLDANCTFSEDNDRAILDCGRTIFFVADFSSPISSSTIRQQLRACSLEGGLPQPVLAYIKRHGLYRVAEPTP